MKKFPIRIITTQRKDTLQIRFLPTDVCNFNCAYCFPGQTEGKYRFPKNTDTVIKNFKFLFDQYAAKAGKTRYDLMLSGGGEPTIWPHIEKFCKEIKESHNVNLSIITNGSRTLRWWEENSHFYDEVILSCHHAFVDIDHFIQVADLLFEKGINVTGLIPMDAKAWDKCVGLVEKMKTSKYKWFIQTKEIVMAPGHGMDVYTPEQVEYLEMSNKRMPDGDWILNRAGSLKIYESVALYNDDSAEPSRDNTYINNGWNFFKGWKCDVALETLFVSFDGSITGSCQEPVFDGKVFNLFSETFIDDFKLDVELKSIICPRTECSCLPETHVSKRL